MSATLILTGLLPFVLLFGAVLAVPTSLLLLRLYRNAVQRQMRRGNGFIAPAHPRATRVPTSSLEIRTIDERSARAADETLAPAYRMAVRGPWRSAAAYAAAGAAYAGIMTAGLLIATGDPVSWTKVLIVFWTYLWPAVIAVILVAAYDHRRKGQLFGVYFGVMCAIIWIAMARNPGTGIEQLPLYWILINGIPTALVLGSLLRRVRAVGPLVLAFMVAVGIGSQAVLSVAAANQSVLKIISNVGFGLGFGANTVFAGMILVGMLAFALLGWPMLGYVGVRYERRKLSDQSITLDAMWLVFGAAQSIGLAFESPPWILTGLVAFLGYKLISRFALRRAISEGAGTQPSTLLQLRVFALGKRSEQLFDRLRKHWQYAGSICMIAGPDLVTSTIEAHEFLDFVRGRLDRQFVTGAADLEARMAAIETTRDPDGRYRVNEFFCHADTWQMTMERLASTTDVVLMDVRGFSRTNQGVIFELGRLLDGVPLSRVVLLVDQTTDRAFLETTLQSLWSNLSASSPNQTNRSPIARLFAMDGQSGGELRALLRVLTQVESPAFKNALWERARTDTDGTEARRGRVPGTIDLATP